MDYNFVSNMLINKQMIGKKQEVKNYRRVSETGLDRDKIPSLEPIEIIPCIKGLKRKSS